LSSFLRRLFSQAFSLFCMHVNVASDRNLYTQLGQKFNKILHCFTCADRKSQNCKGVFAPHEINRTPVSFQLVRELQRQQPHWSTHASRTSRELTDLCPIHTAQQTRQDGPVCVVSGGVNRVGPTARSCFLGRSASSGRTAPSDTDQTQNAPVWLSYQTRQNSPVCHVSRGGVN